MHMKWEICTQHVIDYYLAIVWQMPNFACYSYLYLKLVFDAYRMLVHDYYTRKIWLEVMGLVHREDHRTWGLYTKYTICMLPMLLHDVCTICTISSDDLGTILCLIVTVNLKLYFIQISRWLLDFLTSLVRVCFFAVLLTLPFSFFTINNVTIKSWLLLF